VNDAYEGNVISGNFSPLSGASGHGISLSASSGGHIVAGNYIGTDPTGMIDNGNLASGVLISSNAYNIRVGTNGDGLSDALERNIISGNDRDGINISGGGPHDNLVAGNYIGLNASGDGALANGNQGVILTTAATAYNNVIGYNGIGDQAAMANVISSNPVGVQIGDGTTGNVVQGNTFGSSADTTTALPNNTGIMLRNAAGVLMKDNIVLHSTVSGVTLMNTASFVSGSTDNCIVFNAAGVNNTTGLDRIFTSNWWGASSGPSGAGTGSGDSVSANVAFDPFLTAAPSGCPAYSHAITPSAGTGGSISPDSPQTVQAGESITFTISADPGFIIADVLVDGGSIGAVSSHTFSDVQDDHTISASFTLADHSLSGVLTHISVEEVITYTLVVTNTGSGLQQVVITGSLPLDSSFVAVTGGTYYADGGDYGAGYVDASAALDPGQHMTLVWVVRMPALLYQAVTLGHSKSDYGADYDYGPATIFRWILPMVFAN
jgi:titin